MNTKHSEQVVVEKGVLQMYRLKRLLNNACPSMEERYWQTRINRLNDTKKSNR
ncbi:hypothetical protein [Alteromonas sediminis]|uniref:hypothetical protein n=1 Tax=Alteromonas sediminis TaxID=2259342 RepID=UPI001404DDD5|nr:hypothetical protein [Alteromonas sediminis]